MEFYVEFTQKTFRFTVEIIKSEERDVTPKPPRISVLRTAPPIGFDDRILRNLLIIPKILDKFCQNVL